MRKGVTALLILALVAVIAVAPATAAKKKSGSFSAENPVPHPDPAAGCPGAPDDLSRTVVPLKIPFSGVLTVTMSDFMGDWDLFLTDADGEHIVSATESQLQGAPPQEEVTIYLPKGFSVQMLACNWVGGPSAEVAWTLVAAKS